MGEWNSRKSQDHWTNQSCSHEKQARKNCLQESQCCRKEDVQEERSWKMDQSFLPSSKELENYRICSLQKRIKILQRMHAIIQGIIFFRIETFPFPVDFVLLL